MKQSISVFEMMKNTRTVVSLIVNVLFKNTYNPFDLVSGVIYVVSFGLHSLSLSTHFAGEL